MRTVLILISSIGNGVLLLLVLLLLLGVITDAVDAGGALRRTNFGGWQRNEMEKYEMSNQCLIYYKNNRLQNQA